MFEGSPSCVLLVQKDLRVNQQDLTNVILSVADVLPDDFKQVEVGCIALSTAAVSGQNEHWGGL